MEEMALHIVITGHVDHGKSTLVGRLFYDTGSLPPEKLEELKRISKEMGKELEFAYIMDHLEEEREKGITIDVAHTFFKTQKRRYVIIDAPGHKEFLKNMITGSTQADAALLLVDIEQGVKEQTRRHCYILSLLGIKQVVVLVNKMDVVNYSEQKFNDMKKEIQSTLGKLNIIPSYILPVAAMFGENVAKKSQNLLWYNGLTVLEAIDNLEALKIEEKELRFPIQDVYNIDGKSIAVGRVEAGTIKKGQEVLVLPGGGGAIVKAIKKFHEDDIKAAQPGECIGIAIDKTVKRGQVLVPIQKLKNSDSQQIVQNRIHANIFWMVDAVYEKGMSVTFKCSTQEVSGKIEKIYKRFDPATIDVVEEDAKEIRAAEIAEVEIALDNPVVVDNFTEIPEMGRFVLENAGYPVAGGIVL